VAFAEAGGGVEAQLRGSGECTFIHCDVTDEGAVRAAVEQGVRIYGRLDAAFNAAVVWLCDESSSFVTGQAIAVDGAWTAR
jgi:NAD(P)-dependent dehydrogenase (short-subunit alcohol dehydrogenase family)